MTRFLLLALLAGCVMPPKTVRVQMRRGPIWMQPGSDKVFVWSFRETETTQKTYERDIYDTHGGNKEWRWMNSDHTEIDRVHATVFDPVSGATTQLAEYNHEVQPLYWDAVRSILWVAESQRTGFVVGLSPQDVVYPGGHSFGHTANFVASRDLPMPFVHEAQRGDIFDLESDELIALDRTAGSGVGTVNDRVLRLTRISETMRALFVVDQTVIDWSKGKPTRLPDVHYEAPELPEIDAHREAATVLPDGMRVAEVVTSRSAGTQLYVHDLWTRQITAIPVASLAPPTGSFVKPRIMPLGPDTLAYVVSERRNDDEPGECWRGTTIAIAQRASQPIPDTICITDIPGEPGRAWLETKKASGYVNSDAKMVSLGVKIKSPLPIGPSTIAYAIDSADGGVEIQSLDVATGTATTLGHHASRSDTLLDVNPGRITFASGTDKIVTDVGSGAPRVTTLPSVDK